MKVCVIGAGPSGLTTIKQLLDEGHEVRCFERGDNIGGSWQRIKLLTSPPGHPYVVSPEPMITPTGSYVVFLASKEPANNDNGDAVVWVASLAPGDDFARRVSAGTVQVRKDPEPYQGGARPWVYYTEIAPNGRRLVRRCETGL